MSRRNLRVNQGVAKAALMQAESHNKGWEKQKMWEQKDREDEEANSSEYSRSRPRGRGGSSYVRAEMPKSWASGSRDRDRDRGRSRSRSRTNERRGKRRASGRSETSSEERDGGISNSQFQKSAAEEIQAERERNAKLKEDFSKQLVEKETRAANILQIMAGSRNINFRNNLIFKYYFYETTF